MLVMTENEREKAKEWIMKYLQPSKSKTTGAYLLKHIMQNFIGIYSGEKEFCDCLDECGFKHRKICKTSYFVTVDKQITKEYYRL